MKLTVDGHPLEVPEDLTVAALLRWQGEPAGHVLVEVNLHHVPPGEYETRRLLDGDVVEIILPAFGG